MSKLQRYADFRPTAYDASGAFLDDDRQEWLVLPTTRTRDSGPLDESNFAAALEALGGESDTCEVHRFGHWGPGWFELILIHPDRKEDGEAIAERMENYPVLNEEDFSEREEEQAHEVWKDCYNVAERIEYIRRHRAQFSFRSLADMLGCVRGEYFSGYASELIS